MIISHEKRFAMFRPWKTASQTTSLRLQGYNDSPYDEFYRYNPYLNRIVHQHITCADFACLPESGLGYFTASFVRNPYDRVYSGFRQLQRDIQDQPHYDFLTPWIRNLVIAQLAENRQQLTKAEYAFDSWMALVTEEQIYEIGRNTSFPLHPSHFWTHIAERKVVDFIGRIESYETDFQRFLSQVGIEELPACNANVVDLVGGSLSNPFGYRYVDRMDSRSIEKINYLFERDFELFDYQRLTP
jgi:hypothetical protein